MSGRTPSGDALIDEKFRARDQALTVAMTARDQALTTALTALDKRLSEITDVRNGFNGQLSMLLPKAEYNARHDTLAADLRRVENAVGTLVSKSDFEKVETRMGISETRLATWDGRLWALGSIFLFLNIVVSWMLSGAVHALH